MIKLNRLRGHFFFPLFVTSTHPAFVNFTPFFQAFVRENSKAMKKVTKLILFAVFCGAGILIILFYPHLLEPATGPTPPTESAAPKPLEEGEQLQWQANKDRVDSFYSNGPKINCKTRHWTLKELKEFNTKENLLILINGMVLNVTNFAPHHPGGEAIMAGAGGDDAGEIFTHYHAPGSIALFENFCVGFFDGR